MTLSEQSELSSGSDATAKAATRLISAPLIFGVAGHRDLNPDHISELEGVLRDLFAGFMARCPETTIILLSQLASGADQLAARVAAELGITVIGLLPMPREMYAVDFGSSDSMRQFEVSISACSAIIERPIPFPHSAEEVVQTGKARDHCYAAAGAWAVLHCHALIALWDGTPSSGTGGTADVVEYMLSGAPLAFRPGDTPLEAPRVGPVIHIVTPRMKNPKPVGTPFSVHWLFPGGHALNAKHPFDTSVKQINQFNKDIRAAARPKTESAPGQENDPMSQIIERFAAVDVAALRMKRRSMMAVTCIIVLALLAVVFRELSSNKNTAWSGYTALFAGCFAAAIVVFAVTTKCQWHRRFLDYRSLAEALRVLYFWRLAGIESNVHESYLRCQSDDLVWLHSLVAAWTLTDQTLPRGHSTELPDRLKEVQKHWVRDQAGFFARRASERKTQDSRVRTIVTTLIAFGAAQTIASLVLHTGESWGWLVKSMDFALRANLQSALSCAFLFALGAAVLSLAIGILLASKPTQRSRLRLGMWIAIAILGAVAAGVTLIHVWNAMPAIRDVFLPVTDALALISPLAAAAVHTYGRHCAFDQESRRYIHMQMLFHAAESALDAFLNEGKIQEAQSLIEELGKESLAENGDWLLTHRDRPVSLSIS